MSALSKLELLAVPRFPVVKAGDDLAILLADALVGAGLALRDGDIVVFAQKVVSKAEGRYVDLRQVVPSLRAQSLARDVAKDPRLVEIILSESRRVVRQRENVLIVEHRLGMVMANAGVDQSNVANPDTAELALLLPKDPDASARRLRFALIQRYNCSLAVIVNDSFGRPWRRGTVGVAIGCAGLVALSDLRGRADMFGRPLRVTEVGLADEVAAAASLLMGQADEARPVVIVRGLEVAGEGTAAATLIRSPDEDLFR
ncbi:MAG: coenzyme F420-0:L-glutamate ligase [Burkholderiaceae bacterium]|nr:coenzyme F420-0:L-glutamate ligase [Burkholderiaceae bacterium]